MKKSIIVWNEADVVPNCSDKAVLCLTEKNKVLAFKNAGDERTWKWHVDKYHLTYWIYQDEIEILDL